MKHAFLKMSAASIAALQGINTYIDYKVPHTAAADDGSYYHWENGDIFYRKAGEGSPLLLLHDINVFSSSNEWSQIFAKLSRDHTVYAPDLPGCGRSEKPSRTYTTYLYVQMLTAFVETIIKEKTDVVSSGLAAVPVIMADALDTNLFKSLKLINPPELSSLQASPDDRSKLLVMFSEIPVIGRTCYYIAVNKTNTEDYLAEKCYYNPFEMKQCNVQSAYESAHMGKGNGKYLLASINGNYLNTDISSALKNTDKSITIYFGEYENENAKSAAYQALNENLVIKTIPGTKRYPHMEQPDLVFAEI